MRLASGGVWMRDISPGRLGWGLGTAVRLIDSGLAVQFILTNPQHPPLSMVRGTAG